MSIPRLSRILRIAAVIPVMIVLLVPTGTQARTNLVKLIDDDWDPVVRGRSYLDDPGYEFWIEEALQDAGIAYEVWEIQVDDSSPPNVPSLAELREYPLILWNCAAEADSTLSFAERQVIREYLGLGGRVFLSGQGILNDLYGQMGDPEVADFVENTLGITIIFLDQELTYIDPVPWVPYIDPLDITPLDYSYLPDPLPNMSDPFVPLIDSFLRGHPAMTPISTDRYRPDPIHFQAYLLEAIPDATVRGQYLLHLFEWLGLEGDELEDLMNDTGGFSLLEHCPENDVYWSSTENAFVFSSLGSEDCETVWEYTVSPEVPGCDWRMGFSHQADVAGEYSEMVLMELQGGDDRVEISILDDPYPPGDYAIHYIVEIGGGTVVDTILGDLPLAQIRRTHLEQQPAVLDLKVMDKYGNIAHSVDLPGVAPDFDRLQVRTVGSGLPWAAPISGWIDDYFFEGCLVWDDTAADAAPSAGTLLAAYPNPFNPSTRISARQPVAGRVELLVHDLAGRRQRVLIDEWREAGRFEASWDGRDDKGRRLPSGVYLLSLRTPAGTDAEKLVLLK